MVIIAGSAPRAGSAASSSGGAVAVPVSQLGLVKSALTSHWCLLVEQVVSFFGLQLDFPASGASKPLGLCTASFFSD